MDVFMAFLFGTLLSLLIADLYCGMTVPVVIIFAPPFKPRQTYVMPQHYKLVFSNTSHHIWSCARKADPLYCAVYISNALWWRNFDAL